MTPTNAKFRFPTVCAREGKLIAALMSSDPALIDEVIRRLSLDFGPLELCSDAYVFDDFSSYYAPEMGAELRKQFISFAPMIAVETLPELKLKTNAIEQAYAVGGKRRINIDPGYVTHAQMVLATTKAFSHRVYLGQGIFAELTYVCKGKEFLPLEWTYPDYRKPFAREFFRQVREIYLRETQQRRAVEEGVR
jgi:hypothetical protein